MNQIIQSQTAPESLTFFDILEEVIRINILNPTTDNFQSETLLPQFNIFDEVNSLNPRSAEFYTSYVDANSDAISAEFDVENALSESTYQSYVNSTARLAAAESVALEINDTRMYNDFQDTPTTFWGQISNFISELVDGPTTHILHDRSYEDTESVFYDELWGTNENVILPW